MIIRALRLRHGRVALPRTLLASQRRHQSSLETADAAADADEAAAVEAPVFLQPTSTYTAQAQLDAIPNVRSVHINDPSHPVAQDYAFFQHQKSRTQHLGSALAPHYKPYELLSNPPHPKDITLELLLASQAHIGHATALWHPANARYIFGIRGNKAHGEAPIHIISLEATAAHLRRACRIVSGVTERGGLVLFVGTRQGHARPVVKAASMAKGCHLFTKWIPGSITNGQQILGRCAKKVVNELDQEVEGFEDQLGVKAALKPDLVVCLNPLENYVLLHECGLNNIPTIGIIDTDTNPTWVTYPIPANDDSLRTVQVVAGVLGRAGQEGQERRLMLANRNIITYSATHGLDPPAAPEKKPTRPAPPPTQATPTPVAAPAKDYDLSDAGEAYEEIPQSKEDQQLLDAAQQILAEQGNDSFTEAVEAESEPADEENEYATTTEETEYASPIPEGAEDDVYNASEESIDESLLDDNYGSQSDLATDEDFQQFGGIEQLEASPAPEVLTEAATESPTEQVEDLSEQFSAHEPESEIAAQVDATQAPEAAVAEPEVTSSEATEVPNEQAEASSTSELEAASSDQLEATQATEPEVTSSEATEVPVEQAEHSSTPEPKAEIAANPSDQDQPESPIDQVEEVAEELGEATPEPEAENPSDAAKPEPPVSEEKEKEEKPKSQ